MDRLASGKFEGRQIRLKGAAGRFRATPRSFDSRMKKLFGIGPDAAGDGRVEFEWSPKGNYLAIAGAKV